MQRCSPAQASFHLFGMELLATLDLASTNAFFNTFFRLPGDYWRGFLASKLSSADLILFALAVFTLAPWSIKYKLIEHLVTGGCTSNSGSRPAGDSVNALLGVRGNGRAGLHGAQARALSAVLLFKLL